MKPTVMSVPPLRCSLGGREEFNLTSGKFHKYSHKDVGRSHYTLFSGRPGACSEIFCDKVQLFYLITIIVEKLVPH